MQLQDKTGLDSGHCPHTPMDGSGAPPTSGESSGSRSSRSRPRRRSRRSVVVDDDHDDIPDLIDNDFTFNEVGTTSRIRPLGAATMSNETDADEDGFHLHGWDRSRGRVREEETNGGGFMCSSPSLSLSERAATLLSPDSPSLRRPRSRRISRFTCLPSMAFHSADVDREGAWTSGMSSNDYIAPPFVLSYPPLLAGRASNVFVAEGATQIEQATRSSPFVRGPLPGDSMDMIMGHSDSSSSDDSDDVSPPSDGAPNGSNRRLEKELKELETDMPYNCKIWRPSPHRMHKWRATIIGIDGSAYEGQTFEIDIRIPPSYPFRPPNMHFRTPIVHPNIARAGAFVPRWDFGSWGRDELFPPLERVDSCRPGKVCLDLLGSQASPALRISQLVVAIQSLLVDPGDPTFFYDAEGLLGSSIVMTVLQCITTVMDAVEVGESGRGGWVLVDSETSSIAIADSLSLSDGDVHGSSVEDESVQELIVSAGTPSLSEIETMSPLCYDPPSSPSPSPQPSPVMIDSGILGTFARVVDDHNLWKRILTLAFLDNS